jgi:hypothetical protein
MTKNPDPAGIVRDGGLDRATDPEYAAISTKAVLALVLSLVGAGAFLAAPVLVLAMMGLVLGLAALRQIRRSEGVLAGRGIALGAVAAGAAILAAATAYHGSAWLEKHRMFSDLESRSYEIADDIIADRYAEVYAMMPEKFRLQAGAGPEAFRARMAPLLGGAGSVLRRSLVSLQVLQTEGGQTLAPAEMRVELERRYLQFTIWFQQRPDGQWELVGVAGAETFASLGKFGSPEPDEVPEAPPPPPSSRAAPTP